MKISIDFSKKTGRTIRPLHGLNNSPIRLNSPIPEYAEAGIPFVRLHDTGGAYGGHVYVDVPNLFPDFNADEDNPKNYCFEFTDAYLTQLTASGCQIFYRLGVTIENNYRIRAFRTNPPADFGKWARICEHIIRHYNEGWANGLHLRIQYWEIWNEPENPPMWSGTREQFYELYKVTALHLKKCFPEIKVGGYASCGFYEVSTPDCGEFYKTFIPWCTGFLDYVKTNKVPLDFFSWHRYIEVPDVLIKESQFIRDELDKRGFTETESIYNEWNYLSGSPSQWDDMKEAPAAAIVTKTFILLQRLSVDKAMYYDGMPPRKYCGLFYYPSERTTPVYYAFKAFNALYKLKEEVPVSVEENGPAVLAASDGNSAAALFANTSGVSCWTTLELKNAPEEPPEAWLIDWKHCFEKTPYKPNMVIPPHSVLLLEYGKKHIGKTVNEDEKIKFAGLDGN